MRAKDHINPIGLDSVNFFRNFKGEVTIELTDAKTGKTERVQNHNMVTKALKYFYMQGGITNPTAFNAEAIRTAAIDYLLGGMYCLDTALTEDTEIIRVPAGVGMTANGVKGVLNTGNPTELGSYNETESGWQQDGSLKMVWDFSTSQGNGTIAAVCLTSMFAGFQGIGNGSLTNKANTISPGAYNSVRAKGIPSGLQVIGYYDNNIYTIDNNPNSWGGITTQDIKVYKFPYKKIDVRNIQGEELVETLTVTVPAALQNIPKPRSYIGATCQKGVLTYMIIISEDNSDNVSYSKRAYVAIWNNETRAFVNGYAVEPSGIEDYQNIVGITPTRAILGNYSIDYTNQAVVDELTGAEIAEHTYHPTAKHVLTATQDGTLYSNAGYYFDLTAKKILPTNGAYTLGNFVENPLLGLNGPAIYRDPRYIATIFNLDAPKVKDASKMMKVTYLLTFNSQT